MCTHASVCVLVEDGLDTVAILLGSFVPRNHRVCSDPDSIPFIKWEVMTPALEMRRNCVSLVASHGCWRREMESVRKEAAGGNRLSPVVEWAWLCLYTD